MIKTQRWTVVITSIFVMKADEFNAYCLICIAFMRSFMAALSLAVKSGKASASECI